MISIIAVVGKNRALGKDNKLLWHLPLDLKRFKKITLNHPVIMGRKTYESMGKPLAQRINIVVTKNKKWEGSGCFVSHSFEEAVKTAQKRNTEIFIIGGGKIYQQAIKLADKLYLTLVNDSPKADTFFPSYKKFNKVIYKSTLQKENGFEYNFVELTKNNT